MIDMAVGQVELSRERLRRAMQPPRPRTPALLDARRQRLRRLPLVAEVMDSVAAWWTQHPLRSIAQVAGEASDALALPLAQRHPLLLVLAAGLLGAALVRSRPWRWIFSSALFAGLLPQVVARVAARLPIDAWLEMLAPRPSVAPRQTSRGDISAA